MQIETARARIIVHGAVQGVGFRPFAYRLATELGLRGWALNSSQGVFIEVEGDRAGLDQFLLRLERDKPPRAIIQSLEPSFLDPAGYQGFEVRYSQDAGEKTALIMPDIATCPLAWPRSLTRITAGSSIRSPPAPPADRAFP